MKLPWWDQVAYLEITSFIEASIGAMHFYGLIRYRKEQREIEKQMTRSDVRKLNLLDKDMGRFYGGTYEVGDAMTRFDSTNTIREIALKSWKQFFPGALLLIEGRQGVCAPMRVLDGPRKSLLNKLVDRAEKIGRWDNEKKMQAIADKWDSIMEKLTGEKP